MSNNTDGRYGAEDVESKTSEYNALFFLVNQILNGRNSATLVQVKAVTNAGELAAVGYVDVQPLVNQLDGRGVAVPHGVVNSLPYFRMQGGTSAIVLDPVVGDIGIAVFADRDISSVKATGKAANPGSMRRADMADGLYMGGFLNAIPDQFVRFSASGIEIKSAHAITLDAPTVTLTAATSVTVTTPTFTVNGATQLNGTVTASDTVTAPTVVGSDDVTGGGKSLKSHTHTGGTISGKTGPPI